MSAENWRPVVGWEGFYSVSDVGRVRSEDRTIIRADGVAVHLKGQLMSPVRKNRTGHHCVALMRNSRPTHAFVHRLVLEAFVGPRPDGMVGCHWDDNPDNNRVENLRWATVSENNYDSVRNGTHGNASKTHCVNGHEYTPENTLTNVRPDGRSYRMCYECRKATNRRAWYSREARRKNRVTEGGGSRG